MEELKMDSIIGKTTRLRSTSSAASLEENLPSTRRSAKSISIELPASSPTNTRWSNPRAYGFGHGVALWKLSSTQILTRKSTRAGRDFRGKKLSFAALTRDSALVKSSQTTPAA